MQGCLKNLKRNSAIRQDLTVRWMLIHGMTIELFLFKFLSNYLFFFLLLFGRALCHKSKKCFTTGFPSSLHFAAQSSLIHFAIDVWRSGINDLMIIPVPRRNVKAFWNARNSIPELLPAWLA